MRTPDKLCTRPQSGFTLVELAIVLVIIGLILGALFKGQQMIENGRVRAVVNDLRGVFVAYYAYQDRYKAVPGDDLNAANHISGGIPGDGNSIIAGLYGATAIPANATTESNNFWQHMRLGGFLTGSGTDPGVNALTGKLGVQGNVVTYGMTGNVVCAGSIPLKIAQAADIALDDGDSATGLVRAGAAGDPNQPTDTATSAAYGTAAPANTDTLHTLCMKL